MTNKEKQKYISDLIKSQLPRVKNPFAINQPFVFKNPDTLYKYGKFNKYIFENLNKNQIYLAKPDELDDPFECMGFVPSNVINQEYRKKYYRSILKMLVTKLNISDRSKINDIEKAFSDSITADGIDRKKLFLGLPNEAFTDYELKLFTNIMSNLQNKIDAACSDSNVENFIKTSNDGHNKVGIFSMSEIKNSRIMWSLYSDNYKGYCIEYDFSKSPYLNLLYPVIYKKSFKNNILNNTVMLNESILMEQFVVGNNTADYSWGLTQFLTKDYSWKAQKEWRLLSNPKEFLPSPRINAIYLGCNVAPRNEARMKNYSKKMGFELYKMKIDPKRNKLFFVKI